MAKLADPKKRERHLNIFKTKVRGFDSNYLRKLINKLWDRWTWDTGDELEKQKIEIIERELAFRDEKPWTKNGRRIGSREYMLLVLERHNEGKGNSLRKRRKRRKNKEFRHGKRRPWSNL